MPGEAPGRWSRKDVELFRKFTILAVIAALGSLLSGLLPASAAAPGAVHLTSTSAFSAAQQKAWLAQQVGDLMKNNPGARQVSPDSVRYKGAILGVTPPWQRNSASPDSASGVCPNNWLCLFWNTEFVSNPWDPGSWIKFYSCGINYNLTNYKLSGGFTWANETSSIDYPGSADGHEAKFNHDGDRWLYLYRDHYLANLTKNGGPSPRGNSNDWITGLYVC
jgi:hypothetical protein